MNLRLQPIVIAARDGDGVLVFSEAGLVAVLSRLSDLHEDAAGQWFMEAGFGELEHQKHAAFPDLNTAEDWISDRLMKPDHSREG